MASRRALRHRRAGHSLRGESAHANLSEIKPPRLLARTHRLTISFRRNSQTLFITAIVEAPYEGIGEQGTFAASAAPASAASLSGNTDAPVAARRHPWLSSGVSRLGKTRWLDGTGARGCPTPPCATPRTDASTGAGSVRCSAGLWRRRRLAASPQSATGTRPTTCATRGDRPRASRPTPGHSA